ncbi:DUF6404 family protein [Buttiauxella agrestis]|uniref:Putative membrane protein n=1 Tax=Buttiauxella agrestis ATCC 33320 TaxID=1006004 RepID=A0A085FZH1_9ENTR|nr:DUF6404 family protein [Buttiauxella agrestis]KFC76866.1 putative membrane protein [Buttiauxella agrestis ATCC 33320]
MDFETKKQRALKLLAKTGMWKSTYAPPYVNLLWRFNFRCRPPHFVPFYMTFLNFSLYFGVLWGGIMWFLQWRNDGDTAGSILLKIVSAGITFGLIMTVYYALSRWYYRLPAWKDL